MVYFGVVVKQSLKNPDLIEEFSVVAEKQVGNLTLLLIVAYEDELDNQIKKLQENMVSIKEDCWYNRFFINDSLIVVYQDYVIKTSTNSDDWEEVFQYGVKHGISSTQLDLNPCTKDDAFEFFGLE